MGARFGLLPLHCTADSNSKVVGKLSLFESTVSCRGKNQNVHCSTGVQNVVDLASSSYLPHFLNNGFRADWASLKPHGCQTVSSAGGNVFVPTDPVRNAAESSVERKWERAQLNSTNRQYRLTATQTEIWQKKR